MAQTDTLANEGTTIKVDANLWNVMNDLRLAAHVLMRKHDAYHRQGPRIKKSGTPAERSEYIVVQSSGGAEFMNLATALNAVRPATASARNGMVMVNSRDLSARAALEQPLSRLVNRMLEAGKSQALINDGSDRKKPIGYTGPQLRPALTQAFEALTAVTDYNSGIATKFLLEKVMAPGFDPLNVQKILALPAPGVPSRHTPKPE